MSQVPKNVFPPGTPTLIFLDSSNAVSSVAAQQCHHAVIAAVMATVSKPSQQAVNKKNAPILFRHLYGGYFYAFGVHLK